MEVSKSLRQTYSNSTTHNHYVVGIGFSAGGLDALIKYFDHTPLDGASYIVIQHLPYEYKSRMLEILSKHSSLQVMEITEGMVVTPNCVYLMPDRKAVHIRGGSLYLSDIEKKYPNTAIDVFLDSLARDVKNKSIGIILSGAGTDGTKGVASINKAGGLVIVQEPETALYSSMPSSAIDSGCVHMVLTPEKMPEAVIDYISQASLMEKYGKHLEEADEKALQDILDIVKEKTPLDFSNYKRLTLLKRIIKRMAAHEIESLQQYVNILDFNPTEVERLAQEFLINVTHFFRDSNAFEVISTQVIPEIVENKLHIDPIKVWVVGCATGEEAYSLAILFMEYLSEHGKDIEVKIFASDVDQEAIAFASRGRYSINIAHQVSEQRLQKYFVREGAYYRVHEDLRKMVVFAHHDVTRQPPYTKIDLISCRNLLLYLNYHSQKKLFSTLHYSLNLNGFFFFGPNENIGKLSKHLREIDKTWKIYKNIEAAKTVGNVSYTAAKVASKTSIAYQALSKPVGLVPEHQVNAVVELLLKEFGYDTAIHIDEQFTILHTWGDLDKYLLPKRFNFNLLELLPDVLCVAVGTSVRRSVEEKKKMVVKDVVFQEEAHTRRVDVLVQPIMSPKDVRSIVILFSEHTNSNVQIDTKQFVISDHTSQYVAYLERKLKTSSQELDIALERIQHFNDHAQAYHEELVSSNEEMQSTNEELQSVNEELYTVNHELQAKIKELSEINDDFDNYFRNNVCGQIFVDRNLIIKKFTPATTRLIHLVEADLGKSLMDISIHINFENMIGDIRKVISELKVYEREVQNHEGRWYQMTILPYVRKPKNKIDGAVITFYEITTFKKELEEAIASREHALALKNVALLKMNTDLDGFVHMAAHDLQSPVAAMENLLELATRNPLYNDPGIKSIFSDLANVCGDFKKTVEALTDISKIKKSSYEDISHISLQGITDEVKLYLKDLIQRNDAVIHVDFQRCPVIMFSHANLRTVLCHLINNAITYRSEDRVPEIFIKSYVTEGYNVISIKDNGVGIDSRHSSNLFSMYKRFHKHVKGNGLGLYIVKKIIDHAGGRILVETEVGKGSTFRVLIKSHKMDSL